MKFQYDEQGILNSLENIITNLQNEKSTSSKSLSWKDNPSLIELGWLIIALGDHSKGNPTVEKLLYETMNSLGNATVPSWVCSEEQRQRIIMYYSFKENQSQSRYVDPLIYDQLIFSIAKAAINRISQRSGYEFSEYKGNIYAMP